jgi:hypothetical protein
MKNIGEGDGFDGNHGPEKKGAAGQPATATTGLGGSENMAAGLRVRLGNDGEQCGRGRMPEPVPAAGKDFP